MIKPLTIISFRTITINWKLRDGSIMKTEGNVGENLMRLAHRYEIELEGACEGSCACSTCHVILEEEPFAKLGEPSEDEEDMLDQAPGLTPSSRLGCQVVLAEAHDGMLVTLPSITRNFYVVSVIICDEITIYIRSCLCISFSSVCIAYHSFV